MSKIGKVSLLISGLFVLALGVTRLILGGWHNAMWAPLAIGLAFFCLAMVKDARFFYEFLTMRTTKHGMNMGALILIALVGLVSVNFLAVRYEKKFDWTSEGLNSLSEQSVKAAQGLKQDVELTLLFRKDQESASIERNVKDLVAMYQNASKKIKFSSHSVLTRPDLAQKLDFNAGAFGFFLVVGDRHFKIDQTTEEEITKALIKAGRDKKKVIYFTTGHGEKELEPRKPETISDLKQELESVYEVKPLALFQVGNKIPADADAVAIIGPQQQFLEPELQALRDYARRGGHFLLALDPGTRHNLALLTKSFGVEFKNNYILDPRANIPGAGNIAALGSEFSKLNEITRSMPSGSFAIFLMASALAKAPDAPEGLIFDEIVKTEGPTVTANGLEPDAKMISQGQFAIVVTTKGRLPAGADATKEPVGQEFSAVIAGDSDFLSNTLIGNNMNRDLAMNAFSSLAKDQDLISIRPKSPKGTKLELVGNQMPILFFGFLLPLPVLMFFTGGFVWWRRRAA